MLIATAPSETRLHVSLNDMTYIAGTCMQDYMNISKKLEAPELVKEIGDLMLSDPVTHARGIFHPPQALQLLVRKKASDMQYHAAQMSVEEDGVLKHVPATYAVRDVPVTPAMNEALNSIAKNEPILVTDQGNPALSIGEDGETQRKRVILGHNFFADMETYINNGLREPVVENKQSVSHSFMHNIRTMFGLFAPKSKKDGPTP